MKPRSFTEKKTIFENKHLLLYSVNANFEKFSREYFIVDKGTRAGVILVKGSSVLLVKQYRYVINDFSWELPSGGVKKGETREEAAARECLEETGIKCKKLTNIFDYILSADVLDSPAYIYVCNDFCSSGEFDKSEISEIRWVPLKECIDMVLSMQIKDVFSVIGLLVYNHQRSKLKKSGK